MGRDDERVERVLLGALESGPLDVLGLLETMRTRLGPPFRRGEGLLHVVLHRAVRAKRLEVCGTGPNGLSLYRIAESGQDAPPARDGVDPGPVAPTRARVALRLARGLRSPADRGRVQADVIAHLTELGDERRAAFGSPKAMANLLRRVDRGKPTVVAAWSAGDFFKRVLIHDGPWILGVIVVFFVVRGFVVEVFRIPSASMVPTLQVGDRVAVWKPRSEPKRYEIWTFDLRGTTYVKRVIGLSGEEIALWNGDVFVDGQRLVKPEAVREAMRYPITSWSFRVDEQNPGPGTDWRRVGSHGEVTWIWSRKPLYPNGGTGLHAKSFGFRLRDGYLTVTGDAGSGSLIAGLTRDAYGGDDSGAQGRVLLDVGAEGITLRAFGRNADGSSRKPQDLAHDPRPRSGRMDIEVAYVDGVIHAKAGDWHARVPFEMPDEPLTFEVGTRGRTGGIDLVAVDADIHYAQDATGAMIAVPNHGDTGPADFGHPIPDDCVFFLGDNTVNSNDSRTTEMGDVPAKDLIGPVVFRVWPMARIGGVR